MTYFHLDPAWYQQLVAAELLNRPWLTPEQVHALVQARLRYRRGAAYHRRVNRHPAPVQKRKGGRI